ncbi:hypothetical protein [Streptomyces mirabilis]|uniref:hypothetical protein n=1 Tax=Streptomyces mirabilis TaxID=68239 RepID=UPI0036DA74C2
MPNAEEKEAESGRKPRKSWREVPLAFVAFMLLGNAVLKFLFALISLSSGFSAGKLADALIHLAVGVLISCALLWIFTRLRSRKKRGSAQN